MDYVYICRVRPCVTANFRFWGTARLAIGGGGLGGWRLSAGLAHGWLRCQSHQLIKFSKDSENYRKDGMKRQNIYPSKQDGCQKLQVQKS